MSIYISWPVEIDAAFRPAYAEVVQELIQDDPRTNGAVFLVGSSRINQGHINTLLAAFPAAEFNSEQPEWADEVNNVFRV